MRRPWIPGLALVCASLLAYAAVEAVLVAETHDPATWAGILYVALAVEFVLLGAITWVRRPANRMGALLCLTAFAILTSGLGNTGSPVLVAVGLVPAQWTAAALIHLVLAFPSGQLPDRRSRLLVVGGYLVTFVLPAPLYLFGPAGTVPPALHLADRPDLVQLFDGVQRVCTVAVIGAVAVVWWLRLRRPRPARARVLASVSAYGVLTLLFLDLSANVARLLGIDDLTRFTAQVVVVAGIPVVFAVAIARGGFARAAGLESLGEWLGAGHEERLTLTGALADALGDPSVELYFWLPDEQALVDAYGEPVDPPADPSRGTAEVELDGQRLGVIGYDGDLIGDPALVRAAGRVVALAMDRERLVAELLAGRYALRQSLSRIVEAGDQERRRVARDLHDGLQGRLVVLAVRAGRLATSRPSDVELGRELAVLRADTEAAIASLRELVHGIMPALLVDRGLYVATEDLVDRLPLPARLELPDPSAAQSRLPPAVESAGYFTVAEAVANAVKHARADRLEIRLQQVDHQLRIEVTDNGIGGAETNGSGGLRGITDRIEAVGGRVLVHSPRGAGTRLVAEVPCDS